MKVLVDYWGIAPILVFELIVWVAAAFVGYSYMVTYLEIEKPRYKCVIALFSALCPTLAVLVGVGAGIVEGYRIKHDRDLELANRN